MLCCWRIPYKKRRRWMDKIVNIQAIIFESIETYHSLFQHIVIQNFLTFLISFSQEKKSHLWRKQDVNLKKMLISKCPIRRTLSLPHGRKNIWMPDNTASSFAQRPWSSVRNVRFFAGWGDCDHQEISSLKVISGDLFLLIDPANWCSL